MKSILTLLLFFTVISCSKNSTAPVEKIATGPTCYTGKLVKKGICGQLVVEILSENRGSLQYASEWTDPEGRQVYRNVFTVGNVCDFPSLEQGSTFTFSIHNKPTNDCVLCQAWTPTPAEKNNVLVGCSVQ